MTTKRRRSSSSSTGRAARSASGQRSGGFPPPSEEQLRLIALLQRCHDRWKYEEGAKQLELQTLQAFFGVLNDPIQADPRLRELFRGPAGSYKAPWSKSATPAVASPVSPDPAESVAYAKLSKRSLKGGDAQ